MQALDVQSNMTEGSHEAPEKEIRAIVEAARGGDVRYFEKIFTLFQNRIYGLAWNLTGNYDDAMDVVQECFLRAYRALGSWRGKAKFSTWLHRITVNTAIDFIRREARHQAKRISPQEGEDMDERLRILCDGVERRTPLTELEQKELRRRIMCAINRLKGMQRHCFVLRYFSDLPLKEVALVVGCGEGTVKRHLFRARERLRELLVEG